MKFTRLKLACLLSAVVLLYVGCAKGKPLAPTSQVLGPIHLSIALGGADVSALALASQAQVLYRIAGVDLPSPLAGTLTPGAPVTSASGDLQYLTTLDVPGGGPRLISFQLNDATTQAPIAVGAVDLDLTRTIPAGGLVVDLGSVSRNCTVFNTNSYYGGAYDFATDAFSTYPVSVIGNDMGVTWTGSQYVLQEGNNLVPTQNLIAYLGNGPMVDFPEAPPSASFLTTSTLAKGAPVQVNDVFCVKLSSMPGYAWVQVIDPGNAVLYAYPKFRFRVNSTLPYYAYDRTAADTGNTCSTLW